MKPKTALIHIGTHKTGTTSIQQCLADAARNGGLGSVCYPLNHRNRSHNRLQLLYRPLKNASPYFQQAYPTENWQYRRMLRRYRRSFFTQLARADAAVISAEDLCLFSAEQAARFRADLEAAGFREFHVVLYVRDPADFYLSFVQEHLKCPREPRIDPPDTFTYPFLQMAEAWESVFPGRLIVRRALLTPQEDVTDDFCRVLGTHLDVSLPPCAARMNASLSAEAMQILLDYRQRFWSNKGGWVTPDVSRLIQFLLASRSSLPQTKPVLKDAITTRIRENHQADADMMLSRYGLDLALGPAVPVPRLPSLPEYRVEDIVQSIDHDIVRRLLLELVHTELGCPLSFRVAAGSLRTAAELYQCIPFRSQRLDDWLRSIYHRIRSVDTLRQR